jgi:LPS sulfotransferase NodH
VNDPGFRPVFLQGHHRSGTTILYKVLAETGLFNVTTVYHVVNRERLAAIHAARGEAAARADLQRLFESRGLEDREFDSVPIGPDLPEEYAYALRYQGRRPRLDDRNLDSFFEFCRDVTAIQDPARPLLLKNPFDVDNFVYMRRVLPGAQFVYIHRNPVDVINSQVRTIRSLLDRKNEYVALVHARYRALFEQPLKLAAARAMYSGRLPVLVAQVSRSVARINDYFLRHGAELGDRGLDLTYEELCAEPGRTMARILDFVGVRDGSARDYAALIKPRDAALLPEVARRRERIRARNAEYCRRFGF